MAVMRLLEVQVFSSISQHRIVLTFDLYQELVEYLPPLTRSEVKTLRTSIVIICRRPILRWSQITGFKSMAFRFVMTP
jgi:hypothetical protein